MDGSNFYPIMQTCCNREVGDLIVRRRGYNGEVLDEYKLPLIPGCYGVVAKCISPHGKRMVYVDERDKRLKVVELSSGNVYILADERIEWYDNFLKWEREDGIVMVKEGKADSLDIREEGYVYRG